MKNRLILSGIFLLFVGAGFLFASDAGRRLAELVWLASLVAIAALTIALGVLFIFQFYQRSTLVMPDENGNYPVRRGRKGWVNLNLVGAEESPHAWMIWQATNNRSAGSQARELFSPSLPLPAPRTQQSLMLVERQGQSDVIDAVAREL